MHTAQNGPQCAAFVDVDNTFFRVDRADESRRLTALLAEKGVKLVAVTGARFASVHKRIMGGELPPFAIIAAAVGTEIWYRGSGPEQGYSYQVDNAWAERLIRIYNRGPVVTASERLIGALHRSHPEWGVEFQGGNPQDFKVSLFYMAYDASEAAEIAAELSRTLPQSYRTPWCEDINFKGGERKRYCYDILACDKRDAVNYLCESMGITCGLVAGDSGNDATMILESASVLTGVVVGGSRPELFHAVNAAGCERHDECLYTCRSSGKKLFVEEVAERLGPQSVIRAAELVFNW